MLLRALRRRRAVKRVASQTATPQTPKRSIPTRKLRIDWRRLRWGHVVRGVLVYGPRIEEAIAFHAPWVPERFSGGGDALPFHYSYGGGADVVVPLTHTEKQALEKAARAGRPRVPAFIRNLRPPWSLPAGEIPSDQMGQGELVEEAKTMRPLLREFGFRDSAVRHFGETNKRYLRTCHYLGTFPIKPYILQVVATVGVALFMAILFYFGPENERVGGGFQVSKTVFPIFGGIFGLVFGAGAGFTIRTMAQFWVSHAFARVAQKRMVNGIRRTVAIYELPLPRLAFADRASEQIFSGVEERSGFANGRMNLETDIDLAIVTDPRVFYQPGIIRPCVSTFTGVNATRRHSLNTSAKRAGEINAMKQNQRQNNDFNSWVGEHKGLTFFIASAVVAFVAMAIGIDIDPSQASKIFGG